MNRGCLKGKYILAVPTWDSQGSSLRIHYQDVLKNLLNLEIINSKDMILRKFFSLFEFYCVDMFSFSVISTSIFGYSNLQTLMLEHLILECIVYIQKAEAPMFSANMVNCQLSTFKFVNRH